MYLLQDLRNAHEVRMLYFDDLNTAEGYAVEIMDGMKHLLDSGEWGRTEYEAHFVNLEYTERKAPGWARVYVRITAPKEKRKCQECGAIATLETRAGYFCDKPHYED